MCAFYILISCSRSEFFTRFGSIEWFCCRFSWHRSRHLSYNFFFSCSNDDHFLNLCRISWVRKSNKWNTFQIPSFIFVFFFSLTLTANALSIQFNELNPQYARPQMGVVFKKKRKKEPTIPNTHSQKILTIDFLI